MAKLIITNEGELTAQLRDILDSWNEEDDDSFKEFEDLLAGDDYESALVLAKKSLPSTSFNLLAVWVEKQIEDIDSYDIRKSIDPAIWNKNDEFVANIDDITDFMGLPLYYVNKLSKLEITDTSPWYGIELNHYDMDELIVLSDVNITGISSKNCTKIIVKDKDECKIFQGFKELTKNSTVKELDLSGLTHLSILNLESIVNLTGLEKLYLPEKLDTPLKPGESKPSLGLTLNSYELPSNLEIIKHKEYYIRVKLKEKEQLLPHIKNI